MSSSLAEIAARKRLVLLVGQGGVGKTTCAAAIAVQCACSGRRVAVLTIDPAPRLGTVLGLRQIDESPRAIRLPEAIAAGGSLDAFRLDTKRTFDRIVERLAPGPDAARAILEHRIYRAVSGALGGSDAYMALQRLYELDEEARYEVLVVDTPPVIHAWDLLSAPLRLAALIETDAVRVLANPAIALARAGSRLAKTSAALLLPLLERATGIALRGEIAQFVERFESVLVGLTERSSAVEALLRSEETSFVAVVRPADSSADALESLRKTFATRAIELDAVVVNRLTPPRGRDRAIALEERLTGAPEGTLEAVRAMEADLDARRATEARALGRIRNIVQPGDAMSLVELASLEHDISDLSELESLGRALCGTVDSGSRPDERRAGAGAPSSRPRVSDKR